MKISQKSERVGPELLAAFADIWPFPVSDVSDSPSNVSEEFADLLKVSV